MDAMSHILKIAEIDFTLKSDSMEDEIDDLWKDLKWMSTWYEAMKMRNYQMIISQAHASSVNELEQMGELLSESQKDAKKKDKWISKLKSKLSKAHKQVSVMSK